MLREAQLGCDMKLGGELGEALLGKVISGRTLEIEILLGRLGRRAQPANERAAL